MTLNHNYGCFSTVAGIAGNIKLKAGLFFTNLRIGAVIGCPSFGMINNLK